MVCTRPETITSTPSPHELIKFAVLISIWVKFKDIMSECMSCRRRVYLRLVEETHGLHMKQQVVTFNFTSTIRKVNEK